MKIYIDPSDVIDGLKDWEFDGPECLISGLADKIAQEAAKVVFEQIKNDGIQLFLWRNEKRKGFDLLINICGMECSVSLKELLQQSEDVGENKREFQRSLASYLRYCAKAIDPDDGASDA
jgi:hypothetical protein